MMSQFVDLANCESGAAAIEYALIAALVAVVIVVALNATGAAVSGVFYNIATGL